MTSSTSRVAMTSLMSRLALLLILPALAMTLNVCTDFESTDTSDWFHVSASPKGGMQAGNYSKNPKADTLPKCLKSCCELTATCDTMFFHNGECFLISCNTGDPTACDPKPRSGEKFQQTYLINVRQHADNTNDTEPSNVTSNPEVELQELTPITDMKTSPGGSKPSSSDPSNPPDPDLSSLQSILGNLRQDCDTDTGEGCGRNEECNFVVRETVMGAICQCIRGFTPDRATQECVDDSLLDSGLLATRPLETTCTFGLHGQCEQHEECVPRNGRSRVGHCLCVDGYEEDPETGWCEPTTTPATRSEVSSPDTHAKNSSASDTTTSPTTSPSSKSLTNNVSSTPHTTTTTTTGPSKSPSSSTAASTTSATTPTTTVKAVTLTHHIPLTLPRVTKKTVEPLMVSAGQNKEIRMPINSITLSAYALPASEDGEYKYEWSLVSQPDGDQVGQMDDINTAHLKLSKLIAGLYTFKVAVSEEGKYGEAMVNVTVLEATRQNKAPVAIISPKSQRVNEPNDVVFDGSTSTDDDKIVKYHWEQVSGPLNSNKKEGDNEQTMLVMKGLAPGSYIFKLTVTDSDGSENSTTANVTVIKEMDYPPKANAGSNVILSLPQNSVTLYGNASTDDKSIVSYEWIKKQNEKLTADMTGTRSAFLTLKNLEIGDYTFSLKVTDTAGQSSTADVHVFVKPEHNKPPKAKAGISKVLWLPTSSTTLDGSNSTDDQGISKYTWIQTSGPTTATINNADRAVATASKLVIGTYTFRLTTEDEEEFRSSDDVTITVKENQNHAPTANAGGDQVVIMPVTLVTLDGSHSTDDKGIVSYKWTRDEKSLAAGAILNQSDHTAVLQLINVVAGRYIFTLEVKDAEGKAASDSASIIVREDENSDDLVEIHLEADIGSFSEANKHSLGNQLGLLLHKTNQEGTTQVVVTRLADMAATGELSVTFYVVTVMKDKKVVQRGTNVVSVLKKKLRTDADVIDFRVTLLDTLVCQNNCSSHGHCDSHTKRCVCEAFWMENPLLVYLYEESNCDWSVLYVIIVAFIILVGLAGVTWGIVCLCRRCYKWRPKKRHRYTLLDEFEEGGDGVEMNPRGKIQNSSLMISESDFSSDEETLFVNHKKTNGHVKNGLIKPKNKVKT